LCYYGQGGWTQSEVYKLPVYLRRFYLNSLSEAKKAEQEAMKTAKKRR
jgi:hypothetical protein